MAEKSMSSLRGLFSACTLRMASLAVIEGRSMRTFRSNLPGRIKASSKISTRLVAAMMTMLVLLSRIVVKGGGPGEGGGGGGEKE